MRRGFLLPARSRELRRIRPTPRCELPGRPAQLGHTHARLLSASGRLETDAIWCILCPDRRYLDGTTLHLVPEDDRQRAGPGATKGERNEREDALPEQGIFH